MNPGDLKNTFVDKDGIERTVVIPAEVFKKARKEKISNKVAIQRYLADEGYLDKTAVEETAKADTQKKTRTRKPNDTKRSLIVMLENALMTEYADAVIEVVNAERQVRIELDGKTYEFTLVQKRK